ncbi:DUF4332 domain-containing protein [Prochlorococcus marinus]|uniref:DUF4332 domain-containing protein n=1 Tax=Prochlorococcus marinus (strain MIT 9211) TaxID=93059 RepID=A9BAY3_PROM4|nr:DUF4332 domain-containing protein [Prochlorococcus marinus]ABX08995.1 conserved hypothetical protein [Prochlorococcus marinus str. MIT 9211]
MKLLINKKKIAQNFRKEEQVLSSIGIDNWEAIMNLTDEYISCLVKDKYCTYRNLRRLRCIALFICELNATQDEAALLMHSGISTIEALTNLNPQEIITKTGRFERMLDTDREPVLNLRKAKKLINKAKEKLE